MSTSIRAGLALLGTVAVLGTGALAVGATAQTQPAKVAPTATTTKAPSENDVAAQGRAGVTFLTECVDDNRVARPATFTLSCADGNQRLEKLAWKAWGHEKAQATGVVRENVSEPMSKGDRWITYPVKVTATDLVDGEATATYNRLVVQVTGKTPAGVDRIQSFDLPGNARFDGKGDGHEGMSEDPGTKGWSDGHEGMSEDPGTKGWSDGHEGMSDDPR